MKNCEFFKLKKESYNNPLGLILKLEAFTSTVSSSFLHRVINRKVLLLSFILGIKIQKIL